MSMVRRIAWTLGALIAASVCLLADPVISGPAALTAGRALAVAVGVLAVQLAFGTSLLRRLAPAMLNRPGALGHALAIGIGGHAALLFPLFVLGWCDRTGAVGVLVLVALVSLPSLPTVFRWVRAPPSSSLPQPAMSGGAVSVRPAGPDRHPVPADGNPAQSWLLAGATACLLFPALFDALAPATDTDELSYLLALPRLLVHAGTLPVGVLLPEAGRPLPLQLVAVASYALGGEGVGGEAACRLWHLGVVIVLLGTVRNLVIARGGQGWVAVLALAGSWSVVREAGLAYNDLPVALWLLCAADALLTRRWRLMALNAGLAFACKYTAAPICLALFVLGAWDVATSADKATRWAEARRLALALGLAALPVVPWWIRNVALGQHPLFPFAGWPPVPGMDFVFVYPDKYGLGHTWLDSLLLPFNVLFRAQPNSMVFYGKLSLMWLGLLAVPLYTKGDEGRVVRRLSVLAVAGFMAWALGAQVLRYLLPTLGVGALLLGTARLPRPAWALLLFASFPGNLAPAWNRAASEAAVVTGREDADAYLSRELPPWPALRYARAWIPSDDKVALLGSWSGYYVDQPWILGSVEDHVPTRYWLALHGDEALHTLYAMDVRWLVVGDLPTVRKSYSFLDESTFNQQFRAPAAQLDRLLLRDARRVYSANHTAIWRLDAPAAAP